MEYLTWANRVQDGDLEVSPITAERHDVVQLALLALGFLGPERARS
jgi:hypothetical protein